MTILKGRPMRRLLTCTTALSVALAQPYPLFAQVVADDGRVLGSDGSVLCEPAADTPCVAEDYVEQFKAIEDAMAIAAAAAQAEADAAAAVTDEAKAAEEAAAAAAQAEADAAAAQAATEADVTKAAEEAAAAQAQAEADAAAAEQAATDADATKAAEEAAAAEAAAKAEAEAAAAQAATDADATKAAEEAAAAEAAAQAEADAAAVAAQAEADAAKAAEEAAATDAAATEAVVELTEEELAAQAAAFAAAEAELKIDADGALVDPAANLKTAEPVEGEATEPVDAPVVTDDEVEILNTLLAQPTDLEPVELGAAETLLATPLPEGELPADQAPSDQAVSTTTELLTEESRRTSDQEFAAAPRRVDGGRKRDRLSDLEKVGLVALGALVVGAIIKDSNDRQQDRRVVSNTGDRVVVLNPDGTYQVYKDDDAVIRRPGSNVRTETYRDGSTRTIVERPDGTQVVTIRDATGRVLRRAQYDDRGRELVLIDDLEPEEVVVIRDLPKPRKARVVISTQDEDAELKLALAESDVAKVGRKFSLRQIREIPEVRALAATIDVDAITFDSGSAAIRATEADDLADLGRLMQDMIDRNPREMFLIEGHTDATGSAALNLALSDRRAESVALALTEYFDIPPENMVIQGYGETELRIDTLANEKRNRRVAVRIIGPLLRSAR
jgi:outer membrane protein OmpA-like peptidoglycan-associated protein